MQVLPLIGHLPLVSTLPLAVALVLCLILAFHVTVLPGRVRLKATPLSFGGRRPGFNRSGRSTQ